MPRLKLDITEWTQNRQLLTEGYTYCGRREGLHLFRTQEGKGELYRRTVNGPAGYHLRRGAYQFEFVRSLPLGE